MTSKVSSTISSTRGSGQSSFLDTILNLRLSTQKRVPPSFVLCTTTGEAYRLVDKWTTYFCNMSSRCWRTTPCWCNGTRPCAYFMGGVWPVSIWCFTTAVLIATTGLPFPIRRCKHIHPATCSAWSSAYWPCHVYLNFTTTFYPGGKALSLRMGSESFFFCSW